MLRPEVARQVLDRFADHLEVSYNGILNHVVSEKRFAAAANVKLDPV
jgi:hypothetical protein